MAPPYRIWYERPQFWQKHGFKDENDPRFRELCRTHPDDVLMRSPQTIFEPPPPPPPPVEPAPPTAASTWAAQDAHPIVTTATPTQVDAPLQIATSGALSPQTHLCQRCGRSTVNVGDVLSLEAPSAFIARHATDDIPIQMCWHRSCFEQQYNIKLPKFQDDGAPPLPPQPIRRIIIKEPKAGDGNAVQPN